MKKIKDMLDAKRSEPRLDDGKMAFSSRNSFFRSSRKFKLWYVIYAFTAAATVAAVIALLAFGLSSKNTPLGKELDVTSFADKVAGWFSWIDFNRTSHTDNSNNDDFISLPPHGNGHNGGDTENGGEAETEVGKSFGGIYDFDYSKVPSGYTPVIPMDLSLSSYGLFYVNNETGYTPDIKMLLNKQLNGQYDVLPLSSRKAPLVLIIHTHGTEAYCEDGATYVKDGEDFARTSDMKKNVVAVGETVSEILNRKGVPTVHCKILHDSVQYRDSYARAEETVRKYLEEFPSIRLVIDIHRDAIIKSSGEIVRPVTEHNGEALAQMMCVVGSDWKGDECPNWENNLSLALKLRESLEKRCDNVCRPVFLKGNTYNQELAEYSLLIEIGSSGNSLEEAKRSAELLAMSLAQLVTEI